MSASESPLPTSRHLSADRTRSAALVFLLEQGSGPCRALALALQCLILLDHVGVQQGLQACVPVAGSLGQDTSIFKRITEDKENIVLLQVASLLSESKELKFKISNKKTKKTTDRQLF